MKHLAIIQSEFLKSARKWDDLTLEEQKGYISRHPKTKRRLTARPSAYTPLDKMLNQNKKSLQEQDADLISYSFPKIRKILKGDIDQEPDSAMASWSLPQIDDVSKHDIKIDMTAIDKYIKDSQEIGDDISNVIPTSSFKDIEAISDAADKPAFELEQDINKAKAKVEDVNVSDLTSVMETISAEHLKEVAEAIKSGKMDLDKTDEKITAIRIGSHINLLGGNHRCSALILSGAKSIKVHVINIEDIPKMYEQQAIKPKKAEFPKEDIAAGLSQLPFRGEYGERRDTPRINNDSVETDVRYLGHWESRPGEEDDDYPTWEDNEKYSKLFKEWAERQPWFNSETMKTSVYPGEKSYAYFRIEKRDLKREKRMSKLLKSLVKNVLKKKNNEQVDLAYTQKLKDFAAKMLKTYGTAPSEYYAEQLLKKRRDGSWKIDREKYEQALQNVTR